MLNMWNRYVIAKNLDDALGWMQQYQGGARLIAGGTDLVLDLSHNRLEGVETLIDITRIPDLKVIKFEAGVVSIGAAVTLSEIIQSRELHARVPVLQEAALQIAGPQIRNLATIGGNIINASPAADMTPPLLVLDSTVSILQADQKSREVPLCDFLISNRKVRLEHGEIVTGFHFASPQPAAKIYFRKVQPRRSMAIAMLNIAVFLRLAENQIEEVRIAMGAVAPTAVRLRNVERALQGLSINQADDPQHYAGIRDDIVPISDFRASRDYRLKVAQNLARQAVLDLLELDHNEQ